MGHNRGLIPRNRGRSNRTSRDRGQAELIGLVIIIGLTIGGLTVIVGFGSSALDSSQSQSQTQRAEHAMTQFDSRASLVALGSTESQTLRTNLDGSSADFYVDESAGWMNVTIRNDTAADTVLMNETMGAIVHEEGSTKVAYQGGGVWKTTGDGAVMVSPPEYHFQSTVDDPTLTLPLVTVSGDRNLDSDVTISRDGPVESKYPVDGDDDLSNPFEGGVVEVKIQSEYYRAWGRFMEERADGEVEYDHDREIVTVTLQSTAQRFTIDSGVYIANDDGDINHIHAKQGKSGVDEYNSTVGPYSTSRTGYGELITEGAVEIQDGRFNSSTVISGSGEVRLEKDGWTPGNLSYGGWINNDSDMDFHIRGWVRKGAQVPGVEGIGDLVDDKEAEFRDDNDNDQTDDIVWDGSKWEFDDGQTEYNLTSGDYFINGSDVDWKDGEKLTIDLDDGDVEIVLTSEWKIEDTSRIEVINPEGGTATIYLAAGDKPKFEVQKGGKVTVEGDKAPSLWVFGKRDKQTLFKVDDGSSFTGVMYAPGREGAKTNGEVTKNSELYGAIVVTEIKLEDNGTVHFDESLRGSSPVNNDEYTSDLTFLHVSVNRVKVES